MYIKPLHRKGFWGFYPLHSATESTDKQALTIFFIYTNDLDADCIIYKREGFLAEFHLSLTYKSLTACIWD